MTDIAFASTAGVLERTFRANSDFELVLFDRLPVEQRAVLAGLERDPQFYGILRPKPGSTHPAGIKSVCRDTALLFSTLAQQPGAIPRYVVNEGGQEAEQSIAALVMDGILAMQAGADWITGAAATPFFRQTSSTPEPIAQRRLARLSWEAIQYAASLSLADPVQLAGRLYNFNSLPVSPARLASLLTSADLEAAFPPSRKEWTAASFEGWSAWHSRRASSEHRQFCKLYLSPMPEALPEAFRALVSAAADWGASQFKLGRQGHDLLRPDKFVAYFPNLHSLTAAAQQIRAALDGCPAQGVPFTAAVEGEETETDGLLSWGFDPPPDAAAPEWLRRESWRMKLASRLGSALALAKTNPVQGGSAQSAIEFALERLSLDGIDTATWSPKSHTEVN